MRKLERGERIAVGVWLVVAVVVWNGIYDLLQTRGIKDYLLRNALHQAGRGPGGVDDSPPRSHDDRGVLGLHALGISHTARAGFWTVRAFQFDAHGRSAEL